MTVRRPQPPTRVMRENPDIDQFRRQARELLEAYRAQSPDAVLEVDAYHHTSTPVTFALRDAQFVLARSYGFESWPNLKATRAIRRPHCGCFLPIPFLIVSLCSSIWAIFISSRSSVSEITAQSGTPFSMRGGRAS
jgi:hypothetical protein